MGSKKKTKNGGQDKGRFGVVPETQASASRGLASYNGSKIFAVAVFVTGFALVFGIGWFMLEELNIWVIALALIVAWFAMSSMHIAHQWERLVILRFGKLNRVSDPGLVFTLPIVEYCTMHVDMRVRATPFGAEETLTADLVPLNVDAVLFWFVWDAEKACTEVEDFSAAVELASQTALRDAIGRASVSEIAIRRNQLDKELTRVLEEKVSAWGITIFSVEIRDILVPEKLQDAMSLEAQAEQRKKARIILMEAEQDICDMVSEMGDVYNENEGALRLRAMHLLYESVRETGGTVVVPSSFSEGFGDIVPDDLGKALGK